MSPFELIEPTEVAVEPGYTLVVTINAESCAGPDNTGAKKRRRRRSVGLNFKKHSTLCILKGEY
jgi:hypothetical protein